MIRIVKSRTGGLWTALEEQLRLSYNSGKSVLLLVPEQMTLQSERDAMKALGVKGFFRLQVLSPSRLSKVVFDRSGQDERVVIDERGQNMTISRVMWNLKDDLLYYGKARTRPGFARKLTEAVSEFKSAGLSPEDLLTYAEEKENADPKLIDLALIYQAYRDTMQGQLYDAEDRQKEMLERLSNSDLFAGHDVLVHGFDLLTPPLIRLFALLAGRADNFMLTLQTEDCEAEDGQAFEPVNHSLTRLTEQFRLAGQRFRVETIEETKDARPPALCHLQRQILRLRQEPYQDEPEGLYLYAAKTANEEIRRAAQKIHAQLKRGQDPRGIAVYLAQDSYAALLGDVFSGYGIPHFVSVKEPLTAQALVRCLMDAMKCIQAAVWRPGDVFNYIKSPYSPITAEAAFELENYAREFGIRGKKWLKPFTKGKEERLLRVEEARKAAVTPLDRMREKLNRARDAASSIQAAMDFLSDIGAQEKVLKIGGNLTRMGLHEEAQRAGQVWDRLMGFFEQMNQLLGKERVPLGRFAEWLEAGLSMTSLAALPPLRQSVQAGPLGQLMIREPDIVYVLGLNSGVLNVNEDTLLRDRERARLEEGMKVRLNLQAETRESIRRLDLFKAVAGAGSEAHLSYSLSDEQGKPLSPLMELTRVKKMFPRLREEGGAIVSLREPQAFTPTVALDEIAVLLSKGEMTKPWWEAYRWLEASEKWQPLLASVKAALIHDDPEKTLDRDTATSLMKTDISSVSRLESYAACPFKYFVDYGLKPLERREWTLKNTDLGSFCHAAMEGFTRKVMRRPDWTKMKREESDEAMNRVLSELTEGWEDAPWADTSRARRNAEATLEVCRRMAWALTEGNAASGFNTIAAELHFGPGESLPAIEIELENGETLRLRGTIDRVDSLVLDHHLRFIRVVDYKSGNVKIDAGELEEGAQLQLMLYLSAALRAFDGALPAGAFYQRLFNPLVRAEDETTAVKEARKELRLNGVLLKEKDVVEKMDEAEPPLTLPEYRTRDGEVKNGSNLLSREELDSLMRLAQEKIRELAGGIFKGLITRSPLVRSNGTAACGYCEYQGICRTEKIGGEPLRRRVRKTDLKTLAGEQLSRENAE